MLIAESCITDSSLRISLLSKSQYVLRLLRYIVGVCVHACMSYWFMNLCNCDIIVGFYLSRHTH